MNFVSVRSFARQDPNARRYQARVSDVVSFSVRMPSGQPYVNVGIGEDVLKALGWKQGDKVDARIDNENGRMMFVKAPKGLSIRSPVSEKDAPSGHGCVSFPVYSDICISPAKLKSVSTEYSVSPEGLIFEIPSEALKDGV